MRDTRRLMFGEELDAAILAVTEAGAVVGDLYLRAAAATYAKADGSPVTDADLAADRIIRDLLAARFPHDPVLTEEGADDRTRLASSRCWLVDPIDGTEQFVRRTGDFDVLVALIVDGRPAVAAAYQPVRGLLCAAARGAGAWLREGAAAELVPARLSPVEDGRPIRLATSVWFGAPANLPIVEAVARRLGASAEVSQTGFSPRTFLPARCCDALLGIRVEGDPTMAWEWDFAIADLFVNEAGGAVTDLQGTPFRYNKERPRNEGGLVAAADPTTHARVIEALRASLLPA